MQIVNPSLISGKKVLLRYDIDVALECKVQSAKCKVKEDFKLRAGLATLKLCLENAETVILMGHVGRPEGKIVPALSVEPVRKWFIEQGFSNSKLKILENLRFNPGEEACDVEYAKELAKMGDVYVNEAFSSYRPASSTTVLPTLLPHYAGLHFAKEVETLLNVRNSPKKPFVAIMGGAKVKDKLPVINVLAEKADAVLAGGKLVKEISNIPGLAPRSGAGKYQISNIITADLNKEGTDISQETAEKWRPIIKNAKMIVWNGPVGKFEDPKNDATKKVAQMVLDSGAEIVIGGGDSVAALSQYGLLQKAEKKAFVSVGGGAMLKLLSNGTLPTIEVLK